MSHISTTMGLSILDKKA